MKFSFAAITALLSASAFAAPLETRDVESMAAAVPDWTFKSMKRVCNSANTSCAWSFSIDNHQVAPVPCKFTVRPIIILYVQKQH